MKKILLIIVQISVVLFSAKAQWDSIGEFSGTANITSESIAYDFIPPHSKNSSNPNLHGGILKSTDGWKTWETIYPTNDLIDKISFKNDTVGYMQKYSYYGGGLFQTIDGGFSWVSITGGPPEMDYSFPRPYFGYVDRSMMPRVLELCDYPNWSVQCSLSTLPPLAWLYFINDSVGFMFHYNVFPNVSRSSNYGITWDRLNEELNTIVKILFVDDTAGYCYNIKNQLYKTLDQGDSWIFVCELPFSGINLISFLNKDTGWVAGKGGMIFKTVNGGSDWEQVSSYNSDEIITLKFFNDSTGYYLTVRHTSPTKYYLYKTIIGPWGIEEKGPQQPIRIAPNPVQSMLMLTIDNSKEKVDLLGIFSISGKQMFHSLKFIDQVDVSRYREGVYLLYYRTKGKAYTNKFIVL